MNWAETGRINMENPQFEVIVENVGTIYRGSDRDAAERSFAYYAARLGVGRLGNHVALLKDGEIYAEMEL
jgi:hypothetical protein